MRPRKKLAVLHFIAASIAAMIFLVPPAFFFAVEYRYEEASVNIETEINARIVGQLINANPELWMFEELRLTELLSRRSSTGNRMEIRRVVGLSGSVVAEHRNSIAPPFINARAPLFDAGREVGYLHISRSLQPVLFETLLVALCSLLLGLSAYGVIRGIPLRALREAFGRLEEEKERALITLKSIGDAVMTTDAQMNIEYLNPVAEALTGWSTEEARGRPMEVVFNIVHEQSRERAVNPIRECLEKNMIVEMENHTVLIRRSDNEEFHIEDSAAPIHRADGTIVGAVMVFHDVTDRKVAQSHLHHIAFHDPLTGLPNRALFRSRLANAIMNAELIEKRVAVLFLDLDRIKTINDSLGHDAGDRLLVSVAGRLRECVRDSDMVCRMGGDEFTVILSGISAPEKIIPVAAKIIESVARPTLIDGRELYVSTSIGIAVYPEDGLEIDALVKNADTAMYHAKDTGRNNYQFYSRPMNGNAVRHLQFSNALRVALDNGEFCLEYQPKLDARTGRVNGVEALLRWNHPEFGRVMPSDFISLLEESGDIIAVGDWVLKTAVSDILPWMSAGGQLVMSVNISARQLRQAGFVARIKAVLAEASVSPGLLRLEITESMLMSEADMSERTIEALLAIGVQVSLDDFGTGFSSLGYLRRFPIAELKIDRSFIGDIETNARTGKIVKTIVELGKALDMTVTAEGVESAGQYALLREMGCDDVQGNWLSKPMSAAALREWLIPARLDLPPR